MKITEGTAAVSGSQRRRIWSALEHHPVAWLVFLYVLCILGFVASLRMHRVDGQLTGSDGTYYYSYLPSLILDHDLDFTNQYAALAALAEWAVERRLSAVIFLPAIFLVVWNALFFVQYRFGYIPKVASITFHQMTVGKLTMLKDFPSRLQRMLR